MCLSGLLIPGLITQSAVTEKKKKKIVKDKKRNLSAKVKR